MLLFLSGEESTHSEYVVHQRPFPWTDLDQLHTASRATLSHPFCDGPNANKLAKDLRDLRRCHEIPFLPKDFSATLAAGRGIISGIRIREDLSHVRRNRNRSGSLSRFRKVSFSHCGDSNFSRTDLDSIGQCFRQWCRPFLLCQIRDTSSRAKFWCATQATSPRQLCY